MSSSSSKKVLIEKNGILIFKKDENETGFNIRFDIENKNLDISKIINIDFFKLIHDLNKDIFESIKITKKNENEATIYLLCKDLFADIGLPHYYYYFNIKKEAGSDDRINFLFTPLESIKENNNTINVPLETCEIMCYVKSQSSVQINLEVLFNPPALFSSYVEKMVYTILFKVFNRVKQFVYNIN